MLNIASDTLAVLIIITVLTLVCTFLVLLMLRLLFAKKKSWLSAILYKIRYIILVAICISALFLTFFVVFLKAIGEKDIYNILRAIEDGNVLKVHDSFADGGKYVTEEYIITNRKVKDSLAKIIGDKPCKVDFFSHSFIDTGDIMEIFIYDSELQLTWIRIIGGYILETGQPSKFHRYESTDRELVDKIREIIRESKEAYRRYETFGSLKTEKRKECIIGTKTAK